MQRLNKTLFFLLTLVLLIFAGCQSQFMTAGKIYIDQRNYDDAIEQFKKAVEAEPQNPETYIWLGKAYAYKKQHEEACKQTEKAIEIAPEKLEQLKNDPTFDYWAVFFNSGTKYIKNKDFNNAGKRIRRSLDFRPKSAKSLNLLAYCYLKLDRKDDAEKIYKKAIELIPENIDTYINLGNFYNLNKEVDEQEKILKEARKIVEDPDWLKVEDEVVLKRRKKHAAQVYIELGTVLLSREKPEEAELILQKAIKLSPEDRDVNFNYGVTLYDLEKYTDAIKPFQKVVSLDTLDEEGYFYLGLLYLKTEKYSDAVEAFTNIIEINPSYCEAYINRALAYREMGDKDAAYANAKKGVECKKNKENK